MIYVTPVMASCKELKAIIDKLQKRVDHLEKRVDQVEADNAVKDKIIQALQTDNQSLHDKVNRTTQYTKRQNIRIHGVEVKADKGKPVPDDEAIMNIVKKAHEEVGVNFELDSIMRAHRVGKGTKDEKFGKLKQQIIVRFKDWNARSKFYRARPTVKKPIDKKCFSSIGLDLKTENIALLDKAKEYARSDTGVSYVCAVSYEFS